MRRVREVFENSTRSVREEYENSTRRVREEYITRLRSGQRKNDYRRVPDYAAESRVHRHNVHGTWSGVCPGHAHVRGISRVHRGHCN